MLTRRLALLSSIFAILPLRASFAASAPTVIYRNPGCGCCHEWTEIMKKAGFSLTLEDTDDLAGKLGAMGIPADVQGCHGGMFDDYAISGHVPLEDVKRLLAEKPDAIGITIPGMPAGAPGMGGSGDSFVTLLVKRDGSTEEFARHG